MKTAFAIGATILLAGIGWALSGLGMLGDRITGVEAVNSEQGEGIIQTKTNIENLQRDVAEIKTDVKAILRAVR